MIALSEAQTANNTGIGKVAIDRQLDLGLTLQGPTTIAAGETFTASFSVANLAPETASNVSVAFTLPTGIVMASGEIDNGSCDVSTNTCSIAALPAAATVAGTLTLRAKSTGSHSLSARVSSSSFDPNSPNDVASMSIDVSGAAATSTGSGSVAPSRGGGGTFELSLLFALLGCAWHRRRA